MHSGLTKPSTLHLPATMGRKRKRKQSEAKRKAKYARRVRHCHTPLDRSTKELSEDDDVCRIKHNCILHVDESQAILIRNVYTPSEMQGLQELLACKHHTSWEWRNDQSRGPKSFFISGKWTVQGHARPGKDRLYLAGKAGKRPAIQCCQVHTSLLPLAERAAALLQKHRPDLMHILESLPEEACTVFFFPLFMATLGVANIHKDQNDLISFLFLIKSDGKGGELEIAGTGKCFSWQVGDAIILDSSALAHGTCDFFGDCPEDRMVGLFIVHKIVLRLCSVAYQ